MGEACRALGIPVVGGNVSLYNESRGRDIDPTPVIGMLGVVDAARPAPAGAGAASTAATWCSSGPSHGAVRWPARGGRGTAAARGGHAARRSTSVAHLAVADARARPRGRRAASPACTTWPTGGLALALAEAAVAGGVGAVSGDRSVASARCSRSRRRGCWPSSRRIVADAVAGGPGTPACRSARSAAPAATA